MYNASHELREACGVVALALPAGGEGARRASWGLYALQHRGQESAGIASCGPGEALRRRVGLGWVHQVFGGEEFGEVPGPWAIGHTRYATAGGSGLEQAQPFATSRLALAHNGHLTEVPGEGIGEGSDSAAILRWLDRRVAAGEGLTAALVAFMAAARGAYALVLLTPEAVYAARDPWGFRPLALGRFSGGGWAVASESCGLEAMGCAEVVREVRPGEVVRLTAAGVESLQARRAEAGAFCSLEWLYFARPDSVLGGRRVQAAREALGRQLAREAPAEVECVVGVPESALPAAQAYAAALGLPYEAALVKNRYIGRTFIQPTARLRRAGVRLKYGVIGEAVAGRRVALVDDSLVRGTTAGPLVEALRSAGAREVHLRIAAPPVRHPCHMGVNMTTYEELVAHGRSVEEVRQRLGADSLGYLGLGGLGAALDAAEEPPGRCEACFTGRYAL